jgi:hypothetical protein
MLRAALCLTITAATLAWLLPPALTRARTYPALRAAAAMQSALENRLPRGARVQVLDSDNGAFLAMARAGMRQATPHIQWFSLLLAGEPVRRAFVDALQADPPAAILLTNSQWPQASGFDAADGWPEFAALLASRYVLVQTGDESGIAWRLYLRRRPPSRRLDVPRYRDAKLYALRLSGTLPPLSASLIITCLCSQTFISGEPSRAPV